MKSVLISIRPEGVKKILGGEKTVEVRKNAPKIATPFKCYIYCTKGNLSYETPGGMICHNNGGMVVVGEFVCDKLIPIRVFDNGTIQDRNWNNLNDSCVPYDDLAAYIGRDKTGYGWHISDLKIYDKPKSIGDFKVRVTTKIWSFTKKLERPPQSWCYVEGESE